MRKYKRLLRLLAFDRFHYRRCYQSYSDPWVIGVDEVGRGSLIGPVVSAAVLFKPTLTKTNWVALSELTDSKKLSSTVRQSLVPLIQQSSWFAVAEATQTEVETLNVYQASLLASQRAVLALLDQLPNGSVLILMDGKAPLPLPGYKQHAIIQGDSKSAAIAAASILAKEVRDDWVRTMARNYPDYAWQTNMGYATSAHLAALKRLGPSPLHRKTYAPVQQLALPLQ